MNKLLPALGFCALALSATQANAQQQYWPKWYVGLSGGVTYLDDSDVSGTSTGELGHDTGGAVTASIGYILPVGVQPMSNMRVELEIGYHENSLDNATLSGVATASPGRVRMASYMGNLYYDFRNSSRWTPYLGAGAGLAQVMLSHDSGLGNTQDDEDNVMAYQFMAGFAYAPASMPMTEWGIGYRYFVAHDPEFSTATGNVKLDNIAAHTAEIGARFKF